MTKAEMNSTGHGTTSLKMPNTNPRFSITETVESDAHKQSSHTARTNWRDANPPKYRYNDVETEFVGVDGEGITLANGEHRYVLLGVGQNQIANPDGLEFAECLEFLWSQFRTGSVAYVGFFLGYDFIQMFRRLPEERARMLLTAEGRLKRKPKNPKRVQPFPVEYRGWEFDILGTKRLRIRKAGADRWMHICDTGPFFQKSFLKVIDPKEWSTPIVTDEEYATILEGKQKRAAAMLDDDMLRYNRLENDCLSRVLGQLNTGFQSLGIHLKPSQWFGPGQAAQAWLDGRAITTTDLSELVPAAALEAARMSYFGGWFEIMAHGLIPGITYEYDINSAYPYIISQLPCLEHGKWEHNGIPTSPYTLCYARVRGRDDYIGAMLHRDSVGNISRPNCTEGWYWEHELLAAIRAGVVDSGYDVLDRWVYHSCDCDPPLREVRDIYALRQQVGKKTPLGIACKLVPNSLYGKFAQSIGNPKYGNPIYASLITSGCRTMILDAIGTHHMGTKDVLMVATDGVYFRTPHPSIPVSSVLGQWDMDRKEDITLFKPGVYWDSKTRAEIARGQAPVFKARGVNARDFGKVLSDVDAQFARMAAGEPRVFDRTKSNLPPEAWKVIEDENIGFWWPSVEFPLEFSMVTATQALAWGRWEAAGTVLQEPTGKQSSQPYGKRSNPGWEDGILRTSPKPNVPYEPSYPYEKRFGMEDPFSDESRELDGITTDGLPANLIREALDL
jgi:hypothetical protein